MEGMNMNPLIRNYEIVREQVAEAALNAGRKVEEVRLLAVSKTFPAEDIRTVFDAGQLCFGENRVQELMSKVPVLPPEVEWHLIGHLQSNKAAKAVEYASWIHSVDSAELAQKIVNAAEKTGKKRSEEIPEQYLSADLAEFFKRQTGSSVNQRKEDDRNNDHFQHGNQDRSERSYKTDDFAGVGSTVFFTDDINSDAADDTGNKSNPHPPRQGN